MATTNTGSTIEMDTTQFDKDGMFYLGLYHGNTEQGYKIISCPFCCEKHQFIPNETSEVPNYCSMCGVKLYVHCV